MTKELPRTNKRGVELLRLIQQIIIEEPKRFEIRLAQAVEGVNAPVIGFTGRGGNTITKTLDFPACGTVACVAGWADVLVNGKPSFQKGWGSIALSANHSLRMPSHQTSKLFHLTYWPREFRERYMKANRVRRGKIAANYIEFFIANRHLIDSYTSSTQEFYRAATQHFAK